jgi:hypothetical protein
MKKMKLNGLHNFFSLAARVGYGADSIQSLRDHFPCVLIKLPAETN